MVVPSFTIGVLGRPLFGMGFLDSALVIIFFNFVGVMTVCYFSTLGPVFGLRQMVFSRFWFGWWGVKLSRLRKKHKVTILGYSIANRAL